MAAPTCGPGWNNVPRCRTNILPGITYWSVIAWHRVIVCLLWLKFQGAPENFLTPNRFPGEPPWLWTVPPARFVAVRTEPTPAHRRQLDKSESNSNTYLEKKKDSLQHHNSEQETTSTAHCQKLIVTVRTNNYRPSPSGSENKDTWA